MKQWDSGISAFFLTFMFEPIITKFYMNNNIINTHFLKIKWSKTSKVIKAHIRSFPMVHVGGQRNLEIFSRMSTLWRHIFHKMKYGLKGNPRSYKTLFYAKSILAHSFMDRFWWIFVRMLMKKFCDFLRFDLLT